MIAKSLVGAVALALSAPASSEQPDMVFQNYPLVRRVDCAEGRGTAFKVAGQWLSAAHVTSLHGCKIDGQPIIPIEGDESNDFSRFNVNSTVANGFVIDCDGYKPGHWYWAIGHARGAPFQTAIAAYATIHTHISGMRVLLSMNLFIPGMSGGPVVDPETGKVVGIVNARNEEYQVNFSRELRETSLCRNGAGAIA